MRKEILQVVGITLACAAVVLPVYYTTVWAIFG